MEKAKHDILEVVINGEHYFYSMVQKQNESGIMYNDRIIFLLPDKYIGYISDTKATYPEYIPFEKAKSKISIENIKTVLVNERQLRLKYYAVDAGKRVEKFWLLRMVNQSLTKKWQDKIQFEKTKETLKKQPPKPIEPQSPIKRTGIRDNTLNISHERRTLSFSRTIELSQNPNPRRVTESIGVNASPQQQQPQNVPHFRMIETRQFGTIMSQRSGESLTGKPKKSASRQNVNLGTPILQQQFQKEPSKMEDLAKSGRIDRSKNRPELSDQGVKNQYVSVQNRPGRTEKMPQPELAQQRPHLTDRTPKGELTDRSGMGQTLMANKSMRSQPTGNKLQPRRYDVQPAQDPNLKPEKPIQKEDIKKEQGDFPKANQGVIAPEEKKEQVVIAKGNMEVIVAEEKQESKINRQSKKAQYNSIAISQITKNNQQNNADNKSQFNKTDMVGSKIGQYKNDQQQVRSQRPNAKTPKNDYEEIGSIRRTQTVNPNHQNGQKQLNKSSQINKNIYQLEQDRSSIPKSVAKPLLAPSSNPPPKDNLYSAPPPSIISAPINIQPAILQQPYDPNKLSREKYISPEEYEKMNLSQSYYERTSKLVKKSSVAKSNTNRPLTQNQQQPRGVELQTNMSLRQIQNKKNLDNSNQFSYNKPQHSLKLSAPQDLIEPSNKPQNVSDVPIQIKSSPNKSQFSLHQPINQSGSKLLQPSMVRGDLSGSKSQWIRQEQVDTVLNELQQIPWVFKYVKYNELMFEQFANYVQDLIEELIEDIKLPKESQRYQLKYIKNGVRYYDVNDVQAKIAETELTKLNRADMNGEKVCSKESFKILQNQYNNFLTLYEYLGNSNRMRVPLVCINETSGFVGLFKIIPKGLQKQIRMRELQSQIAALKSVSKINHNFYQNHHRYLVQLDSEFYNQFKDPKNQYDTAINFDLIFVQQLDKYLLPDLATDQQNTELTLLRKQLIQRYATEQIIIKGKEKKKSIGLLSDRGSKQVSQVEQMSDNVFKAISEAIMEIDRLEVYFFGPKELSQYLHGKGINIRYLGHLYDYLQLSFQKQFVMTQMAARSCKALFRKTLQDMTLQQRQRRSDLLVKMCDFLNCVLGDRVQTGAIWKVLSNHAMSYFGVALSLSQINPGQFIVSLVQNCRLDVDWKLINPDEAFKSNNFFNEANLKGQKLTFKIYPAIYNDLYQNTLRIISAEENEAGFEALMEDLKLQNNPIPRFMTDLEQKIKKYLSFFINPQSLLDQSYKNICLYSDLPSVLPSRLNFDMKMIQIKWLLKLKNKQGYIRCCDQFINIATKFYGEFHPIFSELYDTFSAYHLSQEDYEDAVTFCKSSLVNILKICGTHHQKTSESYYNLALCYYKANRPEDALGNFKKAKQIFEDRNKTDSFSYGVILLKLSLLYLNQSKVQDSLKNGLKALSILQKLNITEYQEQLTECYETITRIYQLKRSKDKLKQISTQIGAKLHLINSQPSLQKMLKLYLFPVLTDIPATDASSYLDIISQLNTPTNQEAYKVAFKFLIERIAEGNFCQSLTGYLKKMSKIESYIRQINLLTGWSSFKEVFERQTINDFLGLTEEMTAFLGDGFITGSLRQAL